MFAGIALVLYGVVPGANFVLILVSFVVLRSSGLGLDLLRRQTSVDREHEGLLKLSRPKWELASECIGVIGYVLILPVTIALYTSDFFSLRTPQGWRAADIIALCFTLYAWPHMWLKARSFAKVRAAWWVMPFFPALHFLIAAVESRHPYLNPFHPEHTKLAAERVLGLRSIVVAGRHSDWVLRYAQQLDEAGESERAVGFYSEALRLNPRDAETQTRLAALEGGGLGVGSPDNAAISSSTPYWTTQVTIEKPPRRRIDSNQEGIDECTVMLVAVGDVSRRPA